MQVLKKGNSMKLTFVSFAAVMSSAVALTAPTFAGDLPKTQSVRDTGKLSIANGLAYAPFEFVDTAGKPAGLDIELAEASAKALGVELDITTIPFSSQITALASGRVSIAWSTFSVTEERLKQVDFVTFLSSATVLMTTAENAGRFKSKDDLCGASIAVQTGSIADFAADKLSAECEAAGKAKIEKSIYPEQQDTIQAVSTGRAIGRFDDSTAAGYLETESKGKFVVVPGSYFPTPLGLAVAKGDKETAEMMRATLQQLMDDGTYKGIVDKYNMSTSATDKSIIITDPSQITGQ
ncbi:ABC transporter substrate-binding protein [Neoaquamicrobium sediminum]|uniref:ABC transporter substrate-binding protein n=1 Tax=Neoaquamicrobium sediminum TaxID=1849104 RepID=UPI001FD36E2D|nr:ABC transporter substrate-binding protein [Mesorhizobium sediminum]